MKNQKYQYSTPARKFKDYRTDGRTSKMWILPDGQIQSLDVMHHHWIFGNLGLLKKRYRADFSQFRPDDESVRLSALNQGFVRVNYEHQGGMLTVEANVDRFGDLIQQAVSIIVSENAGSIDNIRVRLLNEAGEIVKSDCIQVYDHDDEEKVKHIPFVAMQSER